MSSKKLVLIAQALWYCSLALPGLCFYSTSEPVWFGLVILLFGWLSPLALNFAWYANLFCWYAISKLKRDETPVISSILALLLSLDMFSFMLPSAKGGYFAHIRGYGWGAILWLLSIFVLLMAVGAKQQEQRKSLDMPSGQDWLGALGFLFFIVTFTATTYFSIHDRMVANQAELKNLEGLAFKLGTVCQLPDPLVKQPIHNFSGVLEVIANTPDYSIDKTKNLLAWGIPVVRVADRDYSLVAKTDNVLVSMPASGVASATLRMDMNAMNATLVETSTNRMVFNQSWPREQVTRLIFIEKIKELQIGNPNNYCPDFNEQPERLAAQALGLSTDKVLPSNPKQLKKEKVEGVFVDHTYNIEKKRGWPGHSIPERDNINCGNDIGWDDTDAFNRILGRPFKMKEKIYYFNGSNKFATCEDSFVYLYSGATHDASSSNVSYHRYHVTPLNLSYYLYIEKRTLSNFQQIWEKEVVIPVLPYYVHEHDRLKIESIKKTDDGEIIELVNDKSGDTLFVQVPLHDKPLP